jgi:hypothetical protein
MGSQPEEFSPLSPRNHKALLRFILQRYKNIAASAFRLLAGLVDQIGIKPTTSSLRTTRSIN